MSTIRKAFNTIKNTDYAAAGQIKVTDLVDGAIAVGPRGQYVQESRNLGLIINGHVATGPIDDAFDIDAIADETITMFITKGRMITYCLSADIYPSKFWEIVEKHTL